MTPEPRTELGAETARDKTMQFLPRIAISGKICAGKTTAANAFVEELGFTRMALADELKGVAREIIDWMWQYLDRASDRHTAYQADHFFPHGRSVEYIRQLKDKSLLEGRAFLQWLGTECLRSRLPDIWVQMLLRRVITPDAPSLVVVDDVRFPNEAEGLRQANFALIRITVPEAVQRERVERLYPQYQNDPSVFSHISEVQLDGYEGWDAVFDGSLPLEEFKSQGVDWTAQTFDLRRAE